MRVYFFFLGYYHNFSMYFFKKKQKNPNQKLNIFFFVFESKIFILLQLKKVS